MSTLATTFEVKYSPESAVDAASRFQDDRFKRYGRLMIAACIINAIGVSAAIWLGARLEALSTLFLIVVVIVGPAWLLYERYVWPQRYASKLLRVLPATGRISISDESISIATVRGDAVIPWSRIGRVLEAQSAFVLVLTPFSFLFIPATDLPAEVGKGLRAKTVKH